MFSVSESWNEIELGQRLHRLAVGVGQLIDLVQHGDARLVAELEDAQRLLDRLALVRGVRMRDIDDVQQHRASVSSSSVARKAATSCVGSFWMKPTVSVSSAGCAASR